MNTETFKVKVTANVIQPEVRDYKEIQIANKQKKEIEYHLLFLSLSCPL